MIKKEEFDRFVEAWGSMGVLWGINRSMARIHAYLLLSNEPVDLDTIAGYLHISRGNASMSLKELRNWGVIRRIQFSGDRKDYYVCEEDMWRMFFLIAGERKKREFDPAINSLRHLLAEEEVGENTKVGKRLNHMEELLSTMDRLLGTFLESEKKSKSMLTFIKTFMSSQ
jgi:DNA-binding transcriptional regulator GbsR (MarR family)